MSVGFWETLAVLKAPGTALTAAARASMTTGATATGARYNLPGGKLKAGDVIEIWAAGSISCAVTTPGTARFDLSFAGVANFDSLAMPLNIVAKTNVGWAMTVRGVVRETGTTGNIEWQGSWDSEAVLGSPLPSAGGSGGFIIPYNTPPAVGVNIDMTSALLVDFNFTQTVATGSVTLRQYVLSLMSSTGY